MAAGKLTLACDGAVRDILCRAIRDYAFAAYPEGGSDCAQVARYTLLELAGQIEAGIGSELSTLVISRRPRAMIRAAVQFHYDRIDAQHADGLTSLHRRALFDALLRETPATRASLEAAVFADRTARCKPVS
jgi:hypothetical protein